ncbi:MAG: MarR family transcriptional regulator [Chlorobi bacterium]|nr:MarR family transcriptional regulator [Chlorobiota bacterium]MCE7935126.1 MarR family transcriptional regulator [Chlorobi bacterium CHB2]
MAKRLSNEQFQTLASFRQALRKLLRTSEDAALAMGMTPQHHQALIVLRGTPDRALLTIGDLAERLQIKHHSTVGLVNRLAAHGYVVREQGKEDRRQVFVKLTKEGNSALDKLGEVHHHELEFITPKLMSMLPEP